uniref:Uncharacterized protein n=1 Tax=viral metagenome TaxID=1070528 RepID=A0A6M3JGK7_9ZZZZ
MYIHLEETDYTSAELTLEAFNMIAGKYGVDWVKYHMEFEDVLAIQHIRKN